MLESYEELAVSAPMRLARPENKAVLWCHAALQAAAAGLLVHSLLRRSRLFVALCLVQMLLLAAPSLLRRVWGVTMATALHLFYLFWCFGSICLGTVLDFYYRIAFWDVLMHGAGGFFITGAAMALPDCFAQSRCQPVCGGLRLLCAVSVSLATATLWELIEYGGFRLFAMDMQHDALLHTFATSYFTNQDAVSDLITGVTGMTLTTDQGLLTFPGYLDLGFSDTLGDMLTHTLGTLLFCILSLAQKGKYASALSVRLQSGPKPAGK